MRDGDVEMLRALSGATNTRNGSYRGATISRRSRRSGSCAAAEATRLLETACRPGDKDGGLYSPSFPERNRAVANAAALLAEAKADASAVRKALDTLVLLVGHLAAQLEVQSP